MWSTTWSCIVHFLTYCILINVSYETPLSGQNVRDAKPNELPFVVSIQTKVEKNNFCVGTLISQRSVLTVLHCLIKININNIDILVGTNDLRQGKVYKPESWISYEQWANQTKELKMSCHDIAVIKLKKRVKEVNPAAILTFVPEELYCQKIRIAGWGYRENETQPMILKTAVVKILSNEFCESKIESIVHAPFVIPKILFCTVANPWVLGDCGDSGAPLLNKYNQLVGIHRGVCPLGITDNYCSEEFLNQNLVNIHLHLYYYRKFINDNKHD